MKFKTLLGNLSKTNSRPKLAVLIDPDKFNPNLVALAGKCKVYCFLVGGSRLENGNITKTVRAIKKISSVPVVLFPGDEKQLTSLADGLFLPALLSGRNPDYLIGKQLIMAPLIKKMNLQSVPMAYLLLGGGRVSSTQQVTQTLPLHPAQITTIVHTAMAAELMGFKLVYLEAGSGAVQSIPGRVVSAVKKAVSLPVIVGGGIDSKQKVINAIKAGANMVVVGNALEKDVYLLSKLSSCF